MINKTIYIYIFTSYLFIWREDVPACHSAHVDSWRSEDNFRECGFFFHHVRILGIKLGSSVSLVHEHLHTLRYLTSPEHTIFWYGSYLTNFWIGLDCLSFGGKRRHRNYLWHWNFENWFALVYSHIQLLVQSWKLTSFNIIYRMISDRFPSFPDTT